jgi:hypothetical protein
MSNSHNVYFGVGRVAVEWHAGSRMIFLYKTKKPGKIGEIVYADNRYKFFTALVFPTLEQAQQVYAAMTGEFINDAQAC